MGLLSARNVKCLEGSGQSGGIPGELPPSVSISDAKVPIFNIGAVPQGYMDPGFEMGGALDARKKFQCHILFSSLQPHLGNFLQQA